MAPAGFIADSERYAAASNLARRHASLAFDHGIAIHRASLTWAVPSRSLSDDEPMRTHVALLRGINVLGRNKLSMAELRQVVASLGHGDVATYIQSGNVMFTAATPDADTTGLADDVEIAIADRLAVRPAVVVLARRELTDVVGDNPFGHEDDHRLLHAVFLREAPGPDGVASVEAAVERARGKESRDDARIIGRTLYLWTPDGFASSILRSELSRGGQHRTPMQTGTARNWRTVNTLVALLET
jgi:uncharacterized protein (DUF1697 family)